MDNIIPILLTIGLMVCIIGMTWNTRQLYRNDSVYNFRQYLLQLISNEAKRRMQEGRNDWEEPYDILDRYTYDDMLNSFKPLTPEAWLSDEELKMLNYNPGNK